MYKLLAVLIWRVSPTCCVCSPKADRSRRLPPPPSVDDALCLSPCRGGWRTSEPRVLFLSHLIYSCNVGALGFLE